MSSTYESNSVTKILRDSVSAYVISRGLLVWGFSWALKWDRTGLNFDPTSY